MIDLNSITGIVTTKDQFPELAKIFADVVIEKLQSVYDLQPKNPNEDTKTPASPAKSPNDFIKVDEVAKITGYASTYIYRLAQLQVVPSYKPHGRGLLFKRGEVIEWLNKSKIMSRDEATAKATETITNLNIKNIRKGGKK